MPQRSEVIQPPRGFLFAAGSAGLRTHGSGPDLALMFSQAPARAAGLFTANRVKAAPVLLSAQHLRDGLHMARAILVNAGNANCATGAAGQRAALGCARQAARLLNLPAEQVLLASTGVIGVPLDARRITAQLPALARQLHPEGCAAVAQAILTTDTRPKLLSRQLSLSGQPVSILGMCKGAGMICPRLAPLATMLAFFFTDAAIEPRFLEKMARRICHATFNQISVDGDTSTNDTVYLLANGMAGNALLKESSAEAESFQERLADVARELAMAMVRDGEGARKLAEIRVEGARTERQAESLARAIALSPLVKTALAGADPNWGRILSAAGNSGAPFDPQQVDIYLNGLRVCRRGGPARFDEAAAQARLKGAEVLIRFVLEEGAAQARFWTCDFTEQYIQINASYRT